MSVLFYPESIRILGSDANGKNVMLCDMAVDDIANLPAANAFISDGYVLSMGCVATAINDNSKHRLNGSGNWIQIAAGTSTYTRAEIDAMQADLQNQIDYSIDTGSKNYLKNSGVTTTNRGIDFTVYADGTVLVNGTNDGTLSSIYTINQQSILQIPNGDYIISGCPSGGDSTTYRIDITRNVGATINDFGDGALFTIGSDYTVIDYRIVIFRNATVNNLIFRPMVRKSYITNPDYEPYAPTNRQLYEMILQLQGG